MPSTHRLPSDATASLADAFAAVIALLMLAVSAMLANHLSLFVIASY